MENTFLIGEISRLFQVDIRTLRYYDTIDLFKPKFVDSATGYRYYSIEQFEQLNTILYLKSLNMPLKNIKLFLDNREIDKILLLLKEQQLETEKRIQEFTQIQQKLENRIHQITDAGNSKELNKIRKMDLPEREIVLLKQKIYKDNNLEMLIRLLENNAKMKSAIFLGKIGLSISIENLKIGSFDEYNSIFIIVDTENYCSDNAKILSKGTYLSIRFEGTHEDASPYYKKLMEHVEHKGYEILEDAIEVTLIDYGFTNDRSKFVTEIQILIK
ncbi:MerR family transcriptional regulator [Psychrobacillus vulpis]|uniref:MerR family transcriptional regulator n=1 Tax=Psychrobacillus vulpis TaxID=2325572 RepID=A0A544TW93_9BACI|nr:MerR family transcriptional regulator [Psychrobacillus vulpis]TQR21725.1 MerR family transcriptional regulator [Psychrobacillus vulpis]